MNNKIMALNTKQIEDLIIDWQKQYSKKGQLYSLSINISRDQTKLAHLNMKIEESGISLFSCSDINIYEQGKGLGSRVINIGFKLAYKEAKKLKLNPAWAYVYYWLKPGQHPMMTDKINSTLRRLDFISHDDLNLPVNLSKTTYLKKYQQDGAKLQLLINKYPQPQLVQDISKIGFWFRHLSDFEQ